MSKQDGLFRPERVDEQIEALAGVEESSAASNAHLISKLYQVYDEESEIVEQVWARLSKQARQKSGGNSAPGDTQQKALPVLRTEQQKEPQSMKSINPKKQKHNRVVRFFEMFAAVLIVAALVGGMALALKARQSSLLAGKSTATPTPASTASSQVGIYAITEKEIEQIDLQSGKTLSHFKDGFSFIPVIAHGVIYFNEVSPADGTVSSSSTLYIDAVNVLTGKQLWRKEYGWGTLLEDNGILFDSSCGGITSTSCSIVGIDARNGTQLWSHNTPLGSSWIAVQDGVVYG
ncbi:MAG: hypothetical protein ACRDHW_08685, partial [Ktedonobacteraceae bacterium]